MLYIAKAPSIKEECHACAWPQLTADLPLSWIGPGDNAIGCFFFKKMPYCGQPVKVSVSVSVYLLARKKKCTVIAQGENW